jgi:hypothetical protein
MQVVTKELTFPTLANWLGQPCRFLASKVGGSSSDELALTSSFTTNFEWYDVVEPKFWSTLEDKVSSMGPSSNLLQRKMWHELSWNSPRLVEFLTDVFFFRAIDFVSTNWQRKGINKNATLDLEQPLLKLKTKIHNFCSYEYKIVNKNKIYIFISIADKNAYDDLTYLIHTGQPYFGVNVWTLVECA